MTQIYYHIASDQHSTYIDSLDKAKSIMADWEKRGDSNIQLFETTKKQEGDVINLNEKSISLNENFKD